MAGVDVSFTAPKPQGGPDSPSWRTRALVAEARVKHREQAFASVFWRLIQESRRRPSAFLEACVLLRRTYRARKSAARALQGLDASRVTIDLGEHRKNLIRVLNYKDARLVTDYIQAGDLREALLCLEAALYHHYGTSVDLLRIVARARAALQYIDNGWQSQSLPHPSVVRRSERRALFVFHSRAPLVNNGYAARSLEVLSAAQAAGWQTNSVTRLGYPNDLNAFRAVRIPLIEDYGGAECRVLQDVGDGVRGRPLDDYLEAYAQRLASEIARTNAGIIHAASNYVNGLAANEAARLTGVASLYEVRGLWEVTSLSRGDYSKLDARYRLSEVLEGAAAQAADRTIAISEGIKNALVDRGVNEENIDVIPNCVNVDQLAAFRSGLSQDLRSPGVVTVGYAGAFISYEGLDLLLEALARCRAAGRDIRAVLIGDGPEAENLRKLASTFRLGKAVTFTGKLSREEAAVQISGADVVALPRRDLPVTRIVPPIKAAEAMARGQALIVSDLPALTEIVDDQETGLVVPPSNVEALAISIIRLADDPALRMRLSINAQKITRERFSLEVAAKALGRAYDAAIEAACRR